MTDEVRGGDPIYAAQHLPAGCGIIFRHYRHPERAALAKELCKVARQNGHLVLIGADWSLAQNAGAHGVHLPQWARGGLNAPAHYRGLISFSAHNVQEIKAANRRNADLVFISPAFATQSHPNERELGTVRLAALAQTAQMPVIALGGITAENATRLKQSALAGMAGISALIKY